MKKVILLIVSLLLSGFMPVFAEKIPIKITPIQVISTHHDETEIGDWIDFEVVDDVYVDDVLVFKKGTKVIGIVDFVHPNGWLGDAAEVNFKKFVTVDSKHKKVEISSPVLLNGNVLVKDQPKQYTIGVLNNIANLIVGPVFIFVRGSEIYLEPDTKTFALFTENL